MSKLKKRVESVTEDVLSDVNDAVEVFSDAAVKTAEVFSDAVSKVAEKQNSFLLRRHSSRQEHYLFAKRETKLGPGIYTVTDKKKDNKYNTLLDQQDPDSFALYYYAKPWGQIGSVNQYKTEEKALFRKKTTKYDYVVELDNTILGSIVTSTENKQTLYMTNFNNWMAVGDFKKNNYKIFDRATGITMAEVSQQNPKTTVFGIDCNHDEQEALLVMMILLIDFINHKK